MEEGVACSEPDPAHILHWLWMRLRGKEVGVICRVVGKVERGVSLTLFLSLSLYIPLPSLLIGTALSSDAFHLQKNNPDS